MFGGTLCIHTLQQTETSRERKKTACLATHPVNDKGTFFFLLSFYFTDAPSHNPWVLGLVMRSLSLSVMLAISSAHSLTFLSPTIASSGGERQRQTDREEAEEANLIRLPPSVVTEPLNTSGNARREAIGKLD